MENSFVWQLRHTVVILFVLLGSSVTVTDLTVSAAMADRGMWRKGPIPMRYAAAATTITVKDYNCTNDA
jgi:hypothetical protein